MKRNTIFCNIMRMIHNTAFVYKAFVSLITFSMIVCIAPANIAYANDANADSETNINVDARARVPYLEASNESKDSKDNSISTNSNATLDLPGAHGYSSALVRVSVFNANNDTTVYVDGAPALQVAAKHDASQTVLAHVADGKLHVYASQAVQARVEVVAFLQSKTVAAAKNQKPAYVPGATVSLAKPVTRMDTNQKVSCTSMSSSAHCKVGLLGLGNIPGEYVRAAYVTMKVAMKNAGNVKVAGQEIALPQGDSVVSTIVVPSSTDGSISVESENAASAELYVRGWVAGAMPSMAHANVTGSFVPSIAKNWVESTTEKDKTSTVALGKQSNDSAFELALVSAHASGKRAFVEYGKPVQGRSTGAVVDAKEGALPQLDFVDTDAKSAKVSARGSNVSSQVLMLGSILGNRPQNDKAETVTVTWTSPKENASIDFSKGKKLTISGTVDAASSVDYVNVTVHSSDNKTVDLGNAAVSYDAHGKAIWSMEIAIPVAGKNAIHVKAVSRTNNSFGTTQRDVNTQLPDAKKTIISDKAKVVMPDELSNDITAVNPDSLVFNKKPQYKAGDILASTPGKNAPRGFLRKVVGVTQQGNTWVVVTEPAMLTDAIYQADISEDRPFSTGNRSLEPIPDKNGETDDSSADSFQTTVHSELPSGRSNRSFDIGKDSDLAKISLGISCDVRKTSGTYCDVEYKSIKKNDEEARKEDIEEDTFASFEAELQFILHFNLKIELDWFKSRVKNFETYISEKGDVTIGAKASEKIKKKIFKHKLVEYHPESPYIFMVGGVPVIIDIVVPIFFDSNLDFDTSVSIGQTLEQNLKLGIEFKNDKWNPIHEGSFKINHVNPACRIPGKIDGKLGVDAGLSIEPTIYLYEMSGVTLRLGIVGKVESNLKTGEEAKHVAQVYMSVKGALEFGTKVSAGLLMVDRDMLDWGPDPWSYEIELFNNEKHPWNIIDCPVVSASQSQNEISDALLAKAGKAYKDVLANGKYKDNAVAADRKYYYTLWDINKDKIPDMIVIAAQSGTMSNTDEYIRVFSYNGKKLISTNAIVDPHGNGEFLGTLYLRNNNDGIITLRSIDENSYTARETVYKIVKNKLKETHSFPRTDSDWRNEIKQYVHPSFISVDDETDVNKLANYVKNTAAKKRYEKTVQKWKEKGYQVFSGEVKTLTALEAARFAKDQSQYSQDVDPKNTYTILSFDRPMSVDAWPQFMDSMFRPSVQSMDCRGVLLSSSEYNGIDSFKSYNGKRLTVIGKPGDVGMSLRSIPYGLPVMNNVFVIKE
ncbi:hypothetical protein [Gardnerella sp. DNF00536]|uniref:hypothetical protein n=1 Tax=Gardnerella sp. DNF00536 TaxID=2749050 RepID=UPI003BB0A429